MVFDRIVEVKLEGIRIFYCNLSFRKIPVVRTTLIGSGNAKIFPKIIPVNLHIIEFGQERVDLVGCSTLLLVFMLCLRQILNLGFAMLGFIWLRRSC